MNEKAFAQYVLSKMSPKSMEDPELVGILGLVGEVGELTDSVKKQMFHSHPATEAITLDEMGDILFYYFILIQAYGFTLQEIMQHVIKKLDARYPEGFDAERSMQRYR